jgi:hypothetical protein
VQGIESFSRWLKASELTDPVDEQDWRQRAAAVDAQRHGWVMWAVHNYLFVKLPLFSPQQALVALLPWLAVFFTRSFCVFVVMCGCLGLYLAGREWERLVAALPELFSLQASVLFVIAIAIVKSLHELGHAMTAVRFGCRVPSMGICFMVMVPMLYTDVSDAWKLPSRRQRVLIDAAGMIVELCVACLALLAWALLPEGPPKALAAMLATTSLLLSLGLNLNPFMRILYPVRSHRRRKPANALICAWPMETARVVVWIVPAAAGALLAPHDGEPHCVCLGRLALPPDRIHRHRGAGLSHGLQAPRHCPVPDRDRLLHRVAGMARSQGVVDHALCNRQHETIFDHVGCGWVWHRAGVAAMVDTY